MTRAQSALEYLMSYGWVLILVIAVGVVLWTSGVFSPKLPSGQQATGRIRIIDFKLGKPENGWQILRLSLASTGTGAILKKVIVISGDQNREVEVNTAIGVESASVVDLNLSPPLVKSEQYTLKLIFITESPITQVESVEQAKIFGRITELSYASVSSGGGAGVHWWNPAWQYRREVTIIEREGVTKTNYQVKITLDTASLISQGKLNTDCSDLRFVGSDDTTILPYWIEGGCGTANTEVWVKVPSIPANGSVKIYVYYGNPSAADASDFSSVFSNVLILDGTTQTFSGDLNYDWIELKNGAVLKVDGNVRLFARKVVIDAASTIDAAGAGYPGGTGAACGVRVNGNGPGAGEGGLAGSGSDGPGGGGAGYGGAGGNGGGAWGSGWDVGDGGISYGSSTDETLLMGSGGGAGAASCYAYGSTNRGGNGGNGGGAVGIWARDIKIAGTISADGANGAQSTSCCSSCGCGGGGGGSGGTILLKGCEVEVTGTLTAKGGNGGPRYNTWGGAGGGGAGGRIKIFYADSYTPGTYDVSGGASGGASYASPAASAGAEGTISEIQISCWEPGSSIGPEESRP